MRGGNTFTQRTFRKEANKTVMKMDITIMVDGQQMELCHFSSDYVAIDIVKDGNCYRVNDKLTYGEKIHSSFIGLQSLWGMLSCCFIIASTEINLSC